MSEDRGNLTRRGALALMGIGGATAAVSGSLGFTNLRSNRKVALETANDPNAAIGIDGLQSGTYPQNPPPSPHEVTFTNNVAEDINLSVTDRSNAFTFDGQPAITGLTISSGSSETIELAGGQGGASTVDVKAVGGVTTVLERTVAISSALEFLADTDRVDVPDSAEFDITDNLTVSAWVKSAGSMAGFNRIVSREQSGSGNRQYNIGLDSGGDFARVIADLQDGSDLELVSTTTVTDGNWHQVAVTFDSSANAILYVDGTQEDSATPSDALVSRASNIRLASVAHTASNLPWIGRIDDARIYQTALGQAGVDALYQEPYRNDVSAGDLVGWWPLNEGKDGTVGGDDVEDLSGNGNDGQNVGANWVEGAFDAAPGT